VAPPLPSITPDQESSQQTMDRLIKELSDIRQVITSAAVKEKEILEQLKQMNAGSDLGLPTQIHTSDHTDDNGAFFFFHQ
jgi:hypothetical protein